MKEIKAVIQPARLARVREAFRKIPDFPGMTVSRAEGSGYHPDKPAPAGIKSELTDYSQKVRIEIIAPDAMVERLTSIIREACHTGQSGDGVVWVTPIEAFARIRVRSPSTGEAA
jgi:nitrogen regulatory protein P-II 1